MADVADLDTARAERAEWSKDITPAQCLKLALKDVLDPKLDLKVTSLFIIGLTETEEGSEMHKWRSNLSVEKEIVLLQGTLHQATRHWVDGTEDE